MTIPKGTLVRLLRSELDKTDDGSTIDRHGELWIVTEHVAANHMDIHFGFLGPHVDTSKGGYRCKAIADGVQDYFLGAEMETCDEAT